MVLRRWESIAPLIPTSVYYKPTDSHSYLLYSSSHPSHVKNSIPFSQFLRPRRLQCANFSINVAILFLSHHRAQQIDRQSALQTAEKENTDRIPFTLTFHPHNHAIKSIILKNLNYSKTIQRLALSFRNPHLFHSNVTKT